VDISATIQGLGSLALLLKTHHRPDGSRSREPNSIPEQNDAGTLVYPRAAGARARREPTPLSIDGFQLIAYLPSVRDRISQSRTDVEARAVNTFAYRSNSAFTSADTRTVIVLVNISFICRFLLVINTRTTQRLERSSRWHAIRVQIRNADRTGINTGRR
jgi:hypothetical protein